MTDFMNQMYVSLNPFYEKEREVKLSQLKESFLENKEQQHAASRMLIQNISKMKTSQVDGDGDDEAKKISSIIPGDDENSYEEEEA